MKKSYKIFTAIFVCAVILGMIACVSWTRSYRNYTRLRSESFIPDTIDIVLYDEDLDQIYVYYVNANYVNVYSDSGEFLWAVATPYIDRGAIALQDGKLIICGREAYIYDSANGAFLQVEKAENLDIVYYYAEETNELREDEFYFDHYQVYKAEADGRLSVVVSRPWWYCFFNVTIYWCMALAGASGVGITMLVEKKREYSAAKGTGFKSRKAKNITNYFQITTLVQIVYAVVYFIVAPFTDQFVIGILPLAIHFIISNIIIWNILHYRPVSEEERPMVNYWKGIEIATFVVAILSVIVATGIATATGGTTLYHSIS